MSSPGASYGVISRLLTEAQAAAEARAVWFRPLAPQTRYTLDVVAGPLIGDFLSLESQAYDAGAGATPYHGELILAIDPKFRESLKQVNVFLHPIDNSDGAQLSVELAKITPDNL